MRALMVILVCLWTTGGSQPSVSGGREADRYREVVAAVRELGTMLRPGAAASQSIPPELIPRSVRKEASEHVRKWILRDLLPPNLDAAWRGETRIVTGLCRQEDFMVLQEKVSRGTVTISQNTYALCVEWRSVDDFNLASPARSMRQLCERVLRVPLPESAAISDHLRKREVAKQGPLYSSYLHVRRPETDSGKTTNIRFWLTRNAFWTIVYDSSGRPLKTTYRGWRIVRFPTEDVLVRCGKGWVYTKGLKALDLCELIPYARSWVRAAILTSMALKRSPQDAGSTCRRLAGIAARCQPSQALIVLKLVLKRAETNARSKALAARMKEAAIHLMSGMKRDPHVFGDEYGEFLKVLVSTFRQAPDGTGEFLLREARRATCPARVKVLESLFALLDHVKEPANLRTKVESALLKAIPGLTGLDHHVEYGGLCRLAAQHVQGRRDLAILLFSELRRSECPHRVNAAAALSAIAGPDEFADIRKLLEEEKDRGVIDFLRAAVRRLDAAQPKIPEIERFLADGDSPEVVSAIKTALTCDGFHFRKTFDRKKFDPKRAVAAYREVLKLRPDHPMNLRVHYYLVQLLGGVEHFGPFWKEALAACDAALKDFPLVYEEVLTIAIHRAGLLDVMGRDQEAMEALDPLINLDVSTIKLPPYEALDPESREGRAELEVLWQRARRIRDDALMLNERLMKKIAAKQKLNKAKPVLPESLPHPPNGPAPRETGAE